MTGPPDGGTAAAERRATDGHGRPGVVGALLAAGTGRRFGDRNKLLAGLDGAPVLVHAARTLAAAPLAGRAVVVGHEAGRVEAALADHGLDGEADGGLETLRNPAHAAGQATSVARAARWARDQEAGALVVALGDMPWVRARTYRGLVAAWRAGGTVVVPTHGGRRGNPVLFDAGWFEVLAGLSGDSGGRQLFERADVTRVAVGDPGVLRDVDRPGDLQDAVEE